MTTLQATDLTLRRSDEGVAQLDGRLDGQSCALPAERHVAVVPSSLRLLVPDAATVL